MGNVFYYEQLSFKNLQLLFYFSFENKINNLLFIDFKISILRVRMWGEGGVNQATQDPDFNFAEGSHQVVYFGYKLCTQYKEKNIEQK